MKINFSYSKACLGNNATKKDNAKKIRKVSLEQCCKSIMYVSELLHIIISLSLVTQFAWGILWYCCEKCIFGHICFWTFADVYLLWLVQQQMQLHPSSLEHHLNSEFSEEKTILSMHKSVQRIHYFLPFIGIWLVIQYELMWLL